MTLIVPSGKAAGKIPDSQRFFLESIPVIAHTMQRKATRLRWARLPTRSRAVAVGHPRGQLVEAANSSNAGVEYGKVLPRHPAGSVVEMKANSVGEA